ncbi:hypothetical protein BDA99DRAFT_543172 [Phascolomyces articulosus]|uniref:Uncharacterized protein n=1 Tax=Phascolomyces articulosus TaxID=60185 RepID=A0AAD5P8G9_9FUNG|nr:hypothetical protein BDA99DRAFT_543172 [Phascolomyces articulosus]
MLEKRRYYMQLIDQISFVVLAPIVAQSAFKHRLVYHDILYEIFRASSIFMTAEIMYQQLPRRFESDLWWSIDHLALSDTAAKKHGIPVEIQVAVVLWHFANFLYGLCSVASTLRITDGSLNHFTDRFIKATTRLGEMEITWPKNDLQRTREMTHQFLTKGGSGRQRLSKVIGAMDRRGNIFDDRNNNASFSLLAVCNSITRFTFVKCGRVDDARAFTSSALYTNLVNITYQMCLDGTYIIADIEDPVTQDDKIIRQYDAFMDEEPRDDTDQELQGIKVSLEPLSLISVPSHQPHPAPQTLRLNSNRISIPGIMKLENELRAEGQLFRSELLDAYIPTEEQQVAQLPAAGRTHTSTQRQRLSRRTLRRLR